MEGVAGIVDPGDIEIWVIGQLSFKSRIRALGSVTSSVSERIKLMNLDYRIVHFLMVVSLFALLATGPSDEGRGNMTFHVDFGFVWGGALVAYAAYLVARHRVRLFDALKSPISSQMRDGFAVVRRYTLGTPYPDDVKKRSGRYNVLATYASLVLVLSFIPLTVGGVGMVFLQRGSSLYELMKILHVGGVGLIALFFLAHFFAVIHADNRPLLRAMFTNGRVPADWAREHLSAHVQENSGSDN